MQVTDGGEQSDRFADIQTIASALGSTIPIIGQSGASRYHLAEHPYEQLPEVRSGSYLAVKGSGKSRPMLGVKQTQNGAERDPLNTRIMCVTERMPTI